MVMEKNTIKIKCKKSVRISPEILVLYIFWFSRSGLDSQFCGSRNFPGIVGGVSPSASLGFAAVVIVVLGGAPQNCAQGPHSINAKSKTQKQQQRHILVCLSRCGI